jgi:hypothetical protein
MTISVSSSFPIQSACGGFAFGGFDVGRSMFIYFFGNLKINGIPIKPMAALIK